MMTRHRHVSGTPALLGLVIALVTLGGTAGPASAMEGRAWGDIHVQTMDGAIYPFQAAGEFVASRSADGDFEVQLRLESTGFSSYVSIATAVAMQVDTTRALVALGREPMLTVNEEPVALQPGDGLDLPQGGRIERSEKGYEVYWSDGSSLSIGVGRGHLNAYLRPSLTRKGTLSGLFGNFDGSALDDVDALTVFLGQGSPSGMSPGVAALARTLLLDEDHGWRVAQQTSLFEYEPGQSTKSFRKPLPKREASVAGLPVTWRQQARATCVDAGVTDPDILEACIVDVGYTRDESFAETAVAVQARNDPDWDREWEEPSR
jgi:hypothetical protein